MESNHKSGNGSHTMKHNHYPRLALMMALSFMAMYILMYAMVDRFQNVFLNINQFYMAALMVSPMLVIEMAVMGAMYQNKKLNLTLIGIGILALGGFWLAIRSQAAIGDRQFLKSMIPHHAGALLMCQQASIQDEETKELCRTILLGQQKEIDQMKRKLESLMN